MGEVRFQSIARVSTYARGAADTIVRLGKYLLPPVAAIGIAACGDSPVRSPDVHVTVPTPSVTVNVPPQQPPTVVVNPTPVNITIEPAPVNTQTPDAGTPALSLCGDLQDVNLSQKRYTIEGGSGVVLNDNFALVYREASTNEGNAIFAIVNREDGSLVREFEVESNRDYVIRLDGETVLVTFAVCSINSGVRFGVNSVEIAADRELQSYSIPQPPPDVCEGITVQSGQGVWLSDSTILAYLGQSESGNALFRVMRGNAYAGNFEVAPGSSLDVETSRTTNVSVLVCSIDANGNVLLSLSDNTVYSVQDVYLSPDAQCTPQTLSCTPVAPVFHEGDSTILDFDSGTEYKQTTSVSTSGGILTYRIEFSDANWLGLPLCDYPVDGRWNWCASGDTHAVGNHKLRIKVFDKELTLTHLNLTEFALAEVSTGGTVNVGDSLTDRECFRVRLVDIVNEPLWSAIMQLEDPSGTALNTVTIDPASTTTISRAGGATTVHVFKTASGSTPGAAWAEFALLDSALGLTDGNPPKFNGEWVDGWTTTVTPTSDGRVASITMTAPEGSLFPACVAETSSGSSGSGSP